MEIAKHIIIVFALSLFVTEAAVSQESRISNTRQASCIVQVTMDSDIMPFGSEELDSLIYSTNVMGKAARKVFGSTETLEVPQSLPDKTEVSLRFMPSTSKGRFVTYPIEIRVMKLQEKIKPAAEEFLKAIIENLHASLNDAYNRYIDEFHVQLSTATHIYEIDEKTLENAQKNNESKENAKNYIITYSDLSEDDKKVYKQLEIMVNLSNLSPDMTLEEVLNIIANSVEPPLQIQPNWRDLADNADILPTTAAEMDPLKSIKIGKAMDILMKHTSNDLANIDYVVQGGVIVIATEGTVPSNLVTMVYDVSGLISPSQSISSIKSSIEKTIEPDSWYDESIPDVYPVQSGGYGIYTPQNGEGKIDIIIGNQLSIYQTPEIQQKIQRFLDSIPIEITAEPVETTPQHVLFTQQQNLTGQKRTLEMDVARLKARQKAIEERIRTIGSQSTSKIKDDPVIKELEQIIDHQTQRLEQFKMMVERGQSPRSGLFDEEDKLSRLKIELAKRREELSETAGGEQLSALNNDLSNTVIDLAGKEAELNEIEKQLSSIESQIKAASKIDPNVLRIRQARKALEEAENRVNELKAKEANLQPPQVIAIGIE